MKTGALLIFIRNPELGKAKTRLAKIIGDAKALIVYEDLCSSIRLNKPKMQTAINSSSMEVRLLKGTF